MTCTPTDGFPTLSALQGRWVSTASASRQAVVFVFVARYSIVDYAGFLSYSRADDEHERGRITELRKGLEGEVAMQLGDDFTIFQDRADVLVGQQWAQRLRGAIGGTTVLVAIITPRFLKSEYCRSEVEDFLKREQELGRYDLIVPILYLLTPGLDVESDLIAVELKKRNYIIWDRFLEPDSADMREALASLAGQIVDAVQREPAEDSDDSLLPDSPADLDDAGLGWLEVQAEAEEAMTELAGALGSYSDKMDEIGALARSAAAELEVARARTKPGAAAPRCRKAACQGA